jgi:hypothetical protein
LLTGGAGIPDISDCTYVTSINFLRERMAMRGLKANFCCCLNAIRVRIRPASHITNARPQAGSFLSLVEKFCSMTFSCPSFSLPVLPLVTS